MTLTQLKDIMGIVESLVTVLGIILGGIWSYMLFIKGRQKYPSAQVTHETWHRALPEGKTLIHVAVTVTNAGKVLISLVSWETRLHQILPLPPSIAQGLALKQGPPGKPPAEMPWPLLSRHEGSCAEGTYEIEPGEEHKFHHDFIVPAAVEVVELYSYIKNQAKPGREIGWDATTLHDVSKQPTPDTPNGR